MFVCALWQQHSSPDHKPPLPDLIVPQMYLGLGQATGSHETAPIMNIPPTNKEVTVTAMVVTRFKKGQNVEGWAELDRLGLMQQLGVVPVPQ
jgi:predicted ester cyclase